MPSRAGGGGGSESFPGRMQSGDGRTECDGRGRVIRQELHMGQK